MRQISMNPAQMKMNISGWARGKKITAMMRCQEIFKTRQLHQILIFTSLMLVQAHQSPHKDLSKKKVGYQDHCQGCQLGRALKLELQHQPPPKDLILCQDLPQSVPHRLTWHQWEGHAPNREEIMHMILLVTGLVILLQWWWCNKHQNKMREVTSESRDMKSFCFKWRCNVNRCSSSTP